MLIFLIILTSAIATPMPIPVPVIQINSVLLTKGRITFTCLARTESAGSATVDKSPNKKPNDNTKINLLYLEKEEPSLLPIGKILESKPTKKNAWPIITEKYPTKIFP